jgi:hypothetical protein
MADERPQDCPTRMATGLGAGFAAGSLFGAVASNWGDVPVVLRNKPLPALVRTGGTMVNFGTTLGLVGLAFSAVDVSRRQPRLLRAPARAPPPPPCRAPPRRAPAPPAPPCSVRRRRSGGRRIGSMESWLERPLAPRSACEVRRRAAELGACSAWASRGSRQPPRTPEPAAPHAGASGAQ